MGLIEGVLFSLAIALSQCWGIRNGAQSRT
jgi:hypothetical protein